MTAKASRLEASTSQRVVLAEITNTTAFDRSVLQQRSAACLDGGPRSAHEAGDARSRGASAGTLDLPSRTRRSQATWRDIDAAHVNDPHMCVQYVNDIYAHLRESEDIRSPNADYMDAVQKDINSTMRGILVDWLVEVAEEYKLTADTLYLSVLYIDRCLSVHTVARTQLQLVGVTCMLIASKYEEIYAPQVDEFCYITDNTYRREDVLAMERTVLDALNFELTQPTTKTFLRRCLRAAEADAKAEFLANFFCELALLEYSFLRFPQSTVAAAAVSLALMTLGRAPWSATMEHYTKFVKADLRECVEALHACHLATQSSSLSSVREKYSQVKFKSVSLIKADRSLLD